MHTHRKCCGLERSIAAEKLMAKQEKVFAELCGPPMVLCSMPRPQPLDEPGSSTARRYYRADSMPGIHQLWRTVRWKRLRDTWAADLKPPFRADTTSATVPGGDARLAATQ